MDRTEYLDTLTDQIRYKKAREMVRKELAAHIEDQKEAYLLAGKSEEEAEEMAVREMGNPVEAGLALNQVHRPKKSVFMLAAAAALAAAGIVMQTIIFSQQDNAYISTHYAVNTVFYNLAGLLLMILISYCDYRLIGKYVWPLYGVYLAGGLLLPHLASSWGQMLSAGKMVCMLFVPLYAAFVYRFRGEKWAGILKCVGILLGNTALLFLFGYYSSGMFLLAAAACLITLFAAALKGLFCGSRKRQAGVLAAVFAGIPAILAGDICLFGGRHLWLADYQIRRLQVMLNPAAYERAEGYQTMLIRRQLSTAGWFGSASLGEIGSLPESWSEYVLTCMASYFGILAVSAVVAVAVSFLLYALSVSVKQKNRLGFLLGVSCSSMLILKTGVYIAMNFGLGPIVGMDMPFLTYGLSNTLANFLLVGLVLSVYRTTNLLTETRGEKIRFRLEKTLEKNV